MVQCYIFIKDNKLNLQRLTTNQDDEANHCDTAR